MKKILLVLLAVLLFGCTVQEKYPDEFISDLPFGLKYYLSENKATAVLDSLANEGILKIPYQGSSSYEYELPLPKESIRLTISPKFHNDSLYGVDVREGYLSNGKSEKENYSNAITFFKSQEIDLNSYIKTYDKVRKEYTWIKQKYEISLHPKGSFIIVFCDGIISDRLSKKATREALEKSRRKDGVKVQNSSWDGSVRQVEEYLKKTLQDPKSYEGIEWSEVVETEEGYIVRHKYRAKNSLGGFVVHNQIFYLDFKGNIVNIE